MGRPLATTLAAISTNELDRLAIPSALNKFGCISQQPFSSAFATSEKYRLVL